jgi:hypothetical protein
MGVIDRLPEHLKNRKTAEAVTAPSALLLAGAGTAVGVVAGVALRCRPHRPRRVRRARGARPAARCAERIDLAGLGQPWRA